MTWCRKVTQMLGALGAFIALTGKETTQQMLILAAIISGVWVWWYGYDYKSQDQIIVGGRFNVMTWVCWTLGLLAAGWFYQALKRAKISLPRRVMITGAVWIAAIMAVEWWGYNKLDIQLKSNYPGLFGLNLMHGPWYLKLYYLTAWAIFLSFMGSW